MARPSSTPANGNGKPPGASGRRLPGRHRDDGPAGPGIWGSSDTLRSRANASGSGSYLSGDPRDLQDPRDVAHRDPRDVDHPAQTRSNGSAATPALPPRGSPAPARQIGRRSSRRRDTAWSGGRRNGTDRVRRLDVPDPAHPSDRGWRRLRRSLSRPQATGVANGSGGAGGLRVSEATVARIGATVLWVLVALAAYGGIRAWLSPSSGGSGDVAAPLPGEQPDGRWAAAGFAERYVAAYLASGSDGTGLTPYLGYTPDLPPTAEPAAVTGPVRMVDVRLANVDKPDYWSVTVAAGEPGSAVPADPLESADVNGETESASATGVAGQTESFWQVSVDTSGERPVAVGLPAPVAEPSDPERRALAVTLSQPPSDDPMVDSVSGFLAAYLCGAPDLDRYLHPDYQHPGAGAPVAADPPVCQEIEIVRWGAARAVAPAGDETADPDDERHVVVAEVTLDSGSEARRATYGLTLVQRDERWEVAALLPAPPVRRQGA